MLQYCSNASILNNLNPIIGKALQAGPNTRFAERNSPGARRRLQRQRRIGSSCDSPNLLALYHARLLSRSGAAAFGRGTADDAAAGRVGAGRVGASGAAAIFFLSMRVCRRSVAGHARLLARSGAARPSAAPAPPAHLSAPFGRTAVLPNPATLACDGASAARYTPQRTRGSN